MRFESTQVKGKGRGKGIGIPTINLQIPPNFSLEDGIYAVRVFLNGQVFKGALHFGPVPSFNENEKSLEVMLLDIEESKIPETENKKIEVEVVKKIRDIEKFNSIEELVVRVEKDVEEIRNYFLCFPQWM
ncbi:hypothetical protein HYS97_03190 [Candidatus Daviesbacteria bacterium]|nr:hypothetical protein [Candidatus Daviesbacteria bacterium]